MAVTTKKSLLFLAGGVAAAAIVAFFAGAFDRFAGPKPETIAASPGSGSASTEVASAPPSQQSPASPEASSPEASPPEASSPEASMPAPEPDTPADPQAGAPAEGPQDEKKTVVPPSFDVVRVERDGSIVIAGKAMPSAKVDLLVGSKLLGSAAAGPEGDFAVVLDEPLDPGDYQIVLRATAPDNVVAMSVETAVVSVPTTADGQVLALVEEPGKPSQMITLPQPQAPAVDATPPAAATEPSSNADASDEPQTAPPAGEARASLPDEAAPAEPAESEPAEPAPAGPAVRVEAVEIDGRKIFVAGVADPGRTVRGYANEILLGDAKASPDGRFLIEADRDLPVGDYIIRVDALEQDGNKVAARAAVPFEREPGQTIAAVASQESQAVAPPQAASPSPEAPAAQGTGEGSAAASGEASGNAGAAATVGGQAPVDNAPAASGPTAHEDQARAPAKPPAPEASETGAGQPAANAPAGSPAAVSEPPATASDTAGSQPDSQQPASGEPANDTPARSQAAGTPDADTDTDTDTAVASAPAEANGALPSPPSADGVTEVLAPKLKSVDSAVIIRRGDTLWRISRRVYGRGVRYSTIYLANQDQIADPDRIWPGQVFALPETSNDGKVDADYSKLGTRLTTIPAEGEVQAVPPEAQQ